MQHHRPLCGGFGWLSGFRRTAIAKHRHRHVEQHNSLSVIRPKIERRRSSGGAEIPTHVMPRAIVLAAGKEKQPRTRAMSMSDTNTNTNSNEEEEGGILGSLLGGDQTTGAVALAAGVVVLTALFLMASSGSSKEAKKAPVAKSKSSKSKAKAKSAASAAAGGGGGAGNKGKKKKKAKAKPAAAAPAAAPAPAPAPAAVPKTAEPEPEPELKAEPEPKAVQFEEKPEAAPAAPAAAGKAKRKRKKKNKPANNGGDAAAAAAAAAPAAVAESGTDTTADEELAREMQQQFNAEAGTSSPTAVADDGWAVAGQAAKKKQANKKKKKAAAAAAAPKPAPEGSASAAAEANGEAAAAAAKTETSVSVQIDAKKVGIVIGPKGSTMQSIEAALDVKIDINAPAKDDPKPSPTATVVITADEANTGGIARAKSAVKDLCTKGYTAITEGPNFAEQYVSVHPRCLAEIVGPGGKTIKALQQALEIKLTIPKTDYNPREAQAQAGKAPNCRVGIAGARENCVAAKKAILELVKYHHTAITHPGWTHEEKDVPQEFFHCIIGRGGSEVKHIRGNFQVEVHLPREDSELDTVLVVGKQSNVDRALAHIDNLIAKDTEQRERKYDDVDEDAWVGEGDDSAW